MVEETEATSSATGAWTAVAALRIRAALRFSFAHNTGLSSLSQNHAVPSPTLVVADADADANEFHEALQLRFEP